MLGVIQGDQEVEISGLGLTWKPLKAAGNSGSFYESKLHFDPPSDNDLSATEASSL